MITIAALFCAVTIWTDLAYRRVPNAVLVAVLIAAGAVMVFGYAPVPPLSVRVAGALLGCVVTLPVYALGRMAAGDVKFLAVAGLFTGPAGLVVVWVAGSLLGMLHAIVCAVGHGPRGTPWRRMLARAGLVPPAMDQDKTNADAEPSRGIPYAGYMAMGMLGWMMFGR